VHVKNRARGLLPCYDQKHPMHAHVGGVLQKGTEAYPPAAGLGGRRAGRGHGYGVVSCPREPSGPAFTLLLVVLNASSPACTLLAGPSSLLRVETRQARISMHAGSRSQFNHTTLGSPERGGLAVWLRLLAADRYRNSGHHRGPRPPARSGRLNRRVQCP